MHAGQNPCRPAPRGVGETSAYPASFREMREYSFHATDDTVEALRRLKAPWLDATATTHAVTVSVGPAERIRLAVETTELEPALEASRLRADVIVAAAGEAAPDPALDVGDLALGRNDVVLFAGETWVEGRDGRAPAHAGNGTGSTAAIVQTLQFWGRPGQRPASAAAVCATTDAIVVAAATGEGVLIRLGIKPLTLDVVRDRAAIARFLIERGYATE